MRMEAAAILERLTRTPDFIVFALDPTEVGQDYANLKFYFPPKSRRPLVLKARNWVKLLDDHDASVQDRTYPLWHQLDLNQQPPFQDAPMLQIALRMVLEKMQRQKTSSA